LGHIIFFIGGASGLVDFTRGNSAAMGVRFVSFCVLAGASACVDPLSGSDVQIDFSNAVQAAARPGATPAPNQPKANTFYRLYAIEDRVDTSDTVIQEYTYAIRDYEIRSIVDQSSPCFIDLEDTRFPGIHVTKYADKVAEQVDIKDPLHPRADATAAEIDSVVDAQLRISHLGDFESKVFAVVDASNAQYGPSETACVDDSPVDETKFPPPKCTGDKANALRLKLCKEFWAAHPDLYEGSDKVFTLPLNGHFRGIVEGSNPANGGFLGGSEFTVSAVLDKFDSYLVTWQFKDLNGDGTPDFADATPAADKKLGHPYMTGTPIRVARGVINVLLSNADDPSISAEMAIFPDFADRGTHF
jgi:hypothetical protein